MIIDLDKIEPGTGYNFYKNLCYVIADLEHVNSIKPCETIKKDIERLKKICAFYYMDYEL